MDPADVTEPDGKPVDLFASTPDEERFPYSECPKCGNKTVMIGYGLAGGGVGTYWFCDTKSCDYLSKLQDRGVKP